MHVLHELRTVIPGFGLVTLYRAKTAAKAKSFQHHNNLQTFEGKKVSAVEVMAEVAEQTFGWVYKPAPVREVRYV